MLPYALKAKKQGDTMQCLYKNLLLLQAKEATSNVEHFYAVNEWANSEDQTNTKTMDTKTKV